MLARAITVVGLLTLGVACESVPLHTERSVAGASGGGRAGDQAGAAGEGGAEGGAAGASAGEFVAPEWLSDTGLFADLLSYTLADGVKPFTPQYELWSDAATKRRFIWLPEGAQIDTSDMNYWRYPVGTKVWKEFTFEGRRIETRLLQKLDSEAWFMTAFRWNGEMTDAVAVPDGEKDARGKSHDIPSQKDCATCHENMPDVLLGLTALQLSGEGEGITLDRLIDDGLLSDPPEQPLVVPGSTEERAALGYLHANCGVCHNAESTVKTEVEMELWLRTDELEDVENTATYRTAVGQPALQDDLPEASSLVEPGDPEHSAVFLRMNSRDPEIQMPPLASETVDPDGVAAIQAWIESFTP